MKDRPNYYKYKSLDNFEFILDILIRERLYAALPSELNDPMEGVVKVDGTIPREKETEWDNLINQFRVVCFSRAKENTLMWSHYADGGRGCMIEFQLLEGRKPDKVSYLKKPALCETQILIEKAAEILLYKEKPWKYEAESRLLLSSAEKFLPIVVKSITFGSRADRKKVNLLAHILKICKPELRVHIKMEQRSVTDSRHVNITFRPSTLHYVDGIQKNNHCPKCNDLQLIRDAIIECNKLLKHQD